MKLGAFSMSLAVKDLCASRAFYAALGFAEAGGDQTKGWLIMRNGETVIGLFQDMFESNILTFNPGWDQSGAQAAQFDDVRAIEAALVDAGLELESPTGGGTGPASLVLRDPDGNVVMLDQHVDAPDR